MALVKLEIDGKRVIADNSQTILQVARENGIDRHPDPLPRRAARAVRLLLPLRGEGQGRAHPAARPARPRCPAAWWWRPTRRRCAARARRPWSCCSRTTTPTASARASSPARPGWTSRATSPWPRSGSTEDAIALIKESNPLPAVCGRVCTRPCEVKGCRRNLLDEAVGIDYIKRYIADLDLGQRRRRAGRRSRRPTGRRWRWSGAGPAGLSCAYYLALRGYGVDIFEALPEAGGMLRYGIPEYRLPKEVLDLEINQILDLGVEAHTNMALGQGLHGREPEARRATRRCSSASAPGTARRCGSRTRTPRACCRASSS